MVDVTLYSVGREVKEKGKKGGSAGLLKRFRGARGRHIV